MLDVVTLVLSFFVTFSLDDSLCQMNLVFTHYVVQLVEFDRAIGQSTWASDLISSSYFIGPSRVTVCFFNCLLQRSCIFASNRRTMEFIKGTCSSSFVILLLILMSSVSFFFFSRVSQHLYIFVSTFSCLCVCL